MTPFTRPDHWNEHARQWHHIGPPLRPAPEDVELFERLTEEVSRSADRQPLRAVLLGVTPEIAAMRWPAATRLTAVDRCEGMIAGVFPREHLRVPAEVVRSLWNELPGADGSVGLVIGDGCYTLLCGTEAYEAVTREVRRVLNPDYGRYLMRYFVRPEQAEPLDRVFDDLTQGRVGNFHIFKWRLAMAIHGTFEEGVGVHQIWEAWNERGLCSATLAVELGWPQEAIDTIHAYRGSAARYSFPTLEEARESLRPHFVELACYYLDYEFGERCPTLLLAPR